MNGLLIKKTMDARASDDVSKLDAKCVIALYISPLIRDIKSVRVNFALLYIITGGSDEIS